MIFYDIESLSAAFTHIDYNDVTDTLNVYILSNTFEENKDKIPEIEAEIRKVCLDLSDTCKINIYDLNDREANINLAQTFGFNSNGMIQNVEFKLLPDYEIGEDIQNFPYIAGYNSLNYDMVILSLYFCSVFSDSYTDTNYFKPISSQIVRVYNDELFSSDFKGFMPRRLNYSYVFPTNGSYIDSDIVHINNNYLKYEKPSKNPAYYVYQNMVSSGRHLDVARLNEKQSRVALKFLLGMLGYQIKEPDISLGDDVRTITWDELKDLIAYNANDVLGTRFLFNHDAYQSAFELKNQMLKDYPELIFADDGTYHPDKSRVKWNRLSINSSSAQLASFSLCPYGSLTDIPTVSFNYPSEQKAMERCVPIKNILQETQNFIDTNLKPLVDASADKPWHEESVDIVNNLEKMVQMYGDIEKKNFNAENIHDDDIPIDIFESESNSNNSFYDISRYQKKVCTPYMNPDGSASSCYVTFSIGGIHGAEYNKALYDADMAVYNDAVERLNKVKTMYPNPLDFVRLVTTNTNKKGEIKEKIVKRKTIELDGIEYPISEFLKSGSTLNEAYYKDEPKKPELFPVDKKTGNPALNKKYAYTSFGVTNHEDFTSYYPSMLIQMSAFENKMLGYDRYAEIFENKTKFGKMMKDSTLTDKERRKYSIMRNGVKLILNSASGAADTDKKTPIRMNNNIIAMRIIGQLFAWRIGQAQALAGARVISTNTDGLYTIFPEEENNKILFEQADATGVGIEPEVMYLVSKDPNNRFEGELAETLTGNSMTDIKITGTAGGLLACNKGPDPTKSLDHPAIQDWALCEVLKNLALSGDLGDYNPTLGLYLLQTIAPQTFTDKEKLLLMFQHIIKSSSNTVNHIFGSRTPITTEAINNNLIQPIALQRHNRIFYVNPDAVDDAHKSDIIYLASAYIRTNEYNGHVPLAQDILANLYNEKMALATGDAKIKKLDGVDTTTPCMIVNQGLKYTDFDPNWLDYNYYNAQLGSAYKNWQNIKP